jgi:hypothetical protein
MEQEKTQAFTATFIERRMAEHKFWQHEAEYALIEEIIDEVQELPRRKPRTRRLFAVPPEFAPPCELVVEGKRQRMARHPYIVQGRIVVDLERKQ